MIYFLIGLVVGVSIGALVMQILQPHYIGTLIVDKTDPAGKTFLYLDLERKPEDVGKEKYVSMKVKEADYFAS